MPGAGGAAGAWLGCRFSSGREGSRAGFTAHIIPPESCIGRFRGGPAPGAGLASMISQVGAVAREWG